MSKSDKYCFVGIFLFSISVYLFTVPPTVFWQDAGIYAAGIAVEGNVYPPGYPLYMMIGILWNNIVLIGSTFQKLSSLSAVFGALSSSFCYLCLKSLLLNISTQFKKLDQLQSDNTPSINSKSGPVNTVLPRLVGALAVIGSVLFTLNYNIWSQAINVEVYALHALFVVALTFLVLRIGERGRIEKKIDSKEQKYVYLMAILYGLSFGNHPMTIVLLPTLLLLVWSQANLFFHSRLLVVAALLFVTSAIAPYAYLPIKANTEPPLNWGNPNTVERFINHVSGKVYLTGENSFVFNDLTRYQAALQEFVWEFSYIGIILAIAGAYMMYKQNRIIFTLFTSIIVLHILFAIFYKQTTEYNSWLIPAHFSIIILIVFSIQKFIESAINLYHHKKALSATLFLIPVVIFFCLLAPKIAHTAQELDRRQYYYAEDFGKNILRNLDPNSLILLTGDQESSTIMYLQLVQKYRPDIIALKNIEFEDLLTGEGRRLLQKRYPELNLTSDSNREYTLVDLISDNLPDRSVYTMSKTMLDFNSTSFTLTPAAAMWKIESTQSPTIDLKYWSFQYHDPYYFLKRERALMSLKDASMPGGVKRVPFIQHMVNFELQSWKNLGDWYYNHQQCALAHEAYLKMETIEQGILSKLPVVNSNLASCTSSVQ